jgi:hypothetical protein
VTDSSLDAEVREVLADEIVVEGLRRAHAVWIAERARRGLGAGGGRGERFGAWVDTFEHAQRR